MRVPRFEPLVIAFILLLCIACNFPDDTFPSDKQLTKIFNDHRSEFENLVTMVTSEDSSMIRIAKDFTSDHAGSLSQARWNEYRSLFDEIDIKHGIHVDGKDIYFIFATQGILDAGSDKGILFSKDTISTPSLYQSLDGRPWNASPATLYKKITDSWYIYYRLDD